MKREIRFTPAFDKSDPDPTKNGGIHGVTLTFYLTGDKGVVQFVVYTNWHLPSVQRELDDKVPDAKFPYTMHQPMAADLGYHSPVPMYNGQVCIEDACKLLDGKPCYYDGSGLAAGGVFNTLREEGDEGVWREMESFYRSTFEEEEEE